MGVGDLEGCFLLLQSTAPKHVEDSRSDLASVQRSSPAVLSDWLDAYLASAAGQLGTADTGSEGEPTLESHRTERTEPTVAMC